LVLLNGKDYPIEYDRKDGFVADGYEVAFCDELASDFMPVFYDPRGCGSTPFPPEFVAYRLIADSKKQKLCVIYEVYWKRQDCTWQELNKDHDHDYEQIQVHFDLAAGALDKVVVSSVGPVENAGHGVEVFCNVSSAKVRTAVYTTSSSRFYPWGGKNGQNNATQIREIPLSQLLFENNRPPVVVLNCYHAFAGVKRALAPDEQVKLNPPLQRLDSKLLSKWYYLYTANRFGHDLSKPFEEPCVMYFPPPGDWVSKVAYSFLWFFSALKRAIGL
jgi:hypothetical protein